MPNRHDTQRTPGRCSPSVLTFLLLGGLGCGVVDNVNSEVNCRAYCSKDFDCSQTEPTSNETDTCVNDCRDAIEDDCGNENQAAANSKVDECVDLACDEFYSCMVFEAAPECFGFTN